MRLPRNEKTKFAIFCKHIFTMLNMCWSSFYSPYIVYDLWLDPGGARFLTDKNFFDHMFNMIGNPNFFPISRHVFRVFTTFLLFLYRIPLLGGLMGATFRSCARQTGSPTCEPIINRIQSQNHFSCNERWVSWNVHYFLMIFHVCSNRISFRTYNWGPGSLQLGPGALFTASSWANASPNGGTECERNESRIP